MIQHLQHSETEYKVFSSMEMLGVDCCTGELKSWNSLTNGYCSLQVLVESACITSYTWRVEEPETLKVHVLFPFSTAVRLSPLWLEMM